MCVAEAELKVTISGHENRPEFPNKLTPQFYRTTNAVLCGSVVIMALDLWFLHNIFN